MSSQQTLDGETPPAEHLTAQAPANNQLGSDGEREWFCTVCGRRVTRSAGDDGEFGHDTDCPHHFTGGER